MQPSPLHGAALLAIAWILASCDGITPSVRVERAVNDVDGFELVLEDPSGRAPSGLLEVGYAIKANYGYFDYRGKRYSSVGGGSVVIRPIAASQAKFIVRETVKSSNEHGVVKTSLLQVIDRSGGDELARRSLVANAVEDGTGWTGDHAVKFVRSILLSPQPPARPWGVRDYPNVAAEVEVTRSDEDSPFARLSGTTDCTGALQIVSRPYDTTVLGPTFEFLPRAPLKFVTCDADRVLVASGVYASDLHLDLLTIVGEHIAQGYVRLPLPLEARWSGMPKVSIEGAGVQATILANRTERNSVQRYGKVFVKTTLKCRSMGCATDSVR